MRNVLRFGNSLHPKTYQTSQDEGFIRMEWPCPTSNDVRRVRSVIKQMNKVFVTTREWRTKHIPCVYKKNYVKDESSTYDNKYLPTGFNYYIKPILTSFPHKLPLVPRLRLLLILVDPPILTPYSPFWAVDCPKKSWLIYFTLKYLEFLDLGGPAETRYNYKRSPTVNQTRFHTR